MGDSLFGQSGGGTVVSDTAQYSFGMEFACSASGLALNGLWWYSPSGAGILPSQIAVYAIAGGSPVASNAASWSGAAGSGWVEALFSSPPVLTAAAKYMAVVFGGDNSNNWYSDTASYWTSGPGTSGISNPPLSAPSRAASVYWQDTLNQASSLAFPTGDANGANYWIDVDVGGSGSAVSGAVSALALAAPAGIPAASAPGPVSGLALAAPAGTPAVSGAAAIPGAVAAMTVRAPAGAGVILRGGGDDPPWHIRKRQR